MDLAEGHLAALNFLKENETQIININLGTGSGTSVLELINQFQDAFKIMDSGNCGKVVLEW